MHNFIVGILTFIIFAVPFLLICYAIYQIARYFKRKADKM